MSRPSEASTHTLFEPLACAVVDWTSRALFPYRYDDTLHRVSRPLAKMGLSLI